MPRRDHQPPIDVAMPQMRARRRAGGEDFRGVHDRARLRGRHAHRQHRGGRDHAERHAERAVDQLREKADRAEQQIVRHPRRPCGSPCNVQRKHRGSKNRDVRSAAERWCPRDKFDRYNARGNRGPLMTKTTSAFRTTDLAHSGRTREEGALALELDHPSRQSSAREHRRAEGRRASGLVRLARRHHDGALFPRAAPAGPRRGEAACEPELPRDPVSARQADAREARSASAATRARRAIRRAPRMPTTWISPPARSASASRRRCSPRWCRTTCARTSRPTSRKAAWWRWSATPRWTRATSSRRCSKAGSRACAIAGG